MTTTPMLDPAAGERARRRIMRRTVPYLFWLFIIAYLDRVNVSYAALEMTKALGFTAEIYGFGAGIFFVGYFLFEIPGSLIVEAWSARKWIARIMVTWGAIAIAMGFVHTPMQFYVLRFLLGVAEAGFFPGIIVYLGHWFRRADRAKTIAMFMSAVPIANMLGAPASGYLLGLDWLGLSGWRWLFILEGVPAIVFGVVTLFYLTDRPEQATWLPDDERDWLVGTLAHERAEVEAGRRFRVVDAIRQPQILVLTGAYFLIVAAVYGLVFWLPTYVKRLSGSGNFTVSLIASLPYVVGLAALLFAGWSSDRTGERRWHAAVPMAVAALGLLASAFAGDMVALGVATLCVAAAGTHGYLPGFWSMPSAYLTGSAAAASVGLINSVGNLGGFVGPYAVGYVAQRTGSPAGGMLLLAGSALGASMLVLALGLFNRSEPSPPSVPTRR